MENWTQHSKLQLRRYAAGAREHMKQPVPSDMHYSFWNSSTISKRMYNIVQCDNKEYVYAYKYKI